jgi:hypothetical protein
LAGGASVTVTGVDVAAVEPPALVAVTAQRSCVPTAWEITSVVAVAPAIGVPFAVHAYANEVGLLDHVPFAHVSVEPAVVDPVTPGSAVLAGAAIVTVVAGEVAAFEPPAFVAVTMQRSDVPTASAITYVELVAPPIGVPFAVHA